MLFGHSYWWSLETPKARPRLISWAAALALKITGFYETRRRKGTQGA
jgi:hypothetical protein